MQSYSSVPLSLLTYLIREAPNKQIWRSWKGTEHFFPGGSVGVGQVFQERKKSMARMV
jgi:hypothetical protein